MNFTCLHDGEATAQHFDSWIGTSTHLDNLEANVLALAIAIRPNDKRLGAACLQLQVFRNVLHVLEIRRGVACDMMKRAMR